MLMLIPALGLAGLAGCSVTPLSADQIYSYAAGAGFSTDSSQGDSLATQLTAIALRESGGCPTAFNPGNPNSNPPDVETSYGLWQININPKGGSPGLPGQLGVSAQQLFDPATNARAAMLLYGGNPNNLNIAWYINRPGPYQDQYQANLPAAEAAAAAFGDGSSPDASQIAPDYADSSGDGTVAFGLTGTELALGGAILAMLAFSAFG